MIKFVSMKDASWLQHLTTHWTKMCVKCVSKALNMSPLSQQVVSANLNPPIQGSSEQNWEFTLKWVVSSIGYVGGLDCCSIPMLSQA